MRGARLLFLYALLASHSSFGWSCSELLNAVNRIPLSHFLSQKELLDRYGGQHGFCTTACLTNTEVVMRSLLKGEVTQATFDRAEEIKKEIEKLSPAKDPRNVLLPVKQRLVQNLTRQWNELGVYAQSLGDHGTGGQQGRVSPKYLFGDSNTEASLWIPTMTFYVNDRLLRDTGHSILVLPIDEQNLKVRVIDSRLLDRPYYATVHQRGNKVFLEMEDPRYVSFWESQFGLPGFEDGRNHRLEITGLAIDRAMRLTQEVKMFFRPPHTHPPDRIPLRLHNSERRRVLSR